MKSDYPPEIEEIIKHDPFCDWRLPAILEVTRWYKDGDLKLERASGSMFHKLKRAVRDDEAYILCAQNPVISDDLFNPEAHTFVVQHDWAAAFSGSHDFDEGNFNFPFDECVFEFKISGKSVIVLCTDLSGYKTVMPFVEITDGWVLPQHVYEFKDGDWNEVKQNLGDDEFGALKTLIINQIRAVCISLEAGVAISDVVTAPPRLNAARIKRGQPPLDDYHVVDLSRRHTRSVRSIGEPTGIRVRLHFRRGHIRHLSEDKKVWVNWCLVGDPDLGFIEKEYRL